MAKKHGDVVVISDTQVTPMSPTDHLHALSRYIWKHRPACIVHIGDHWDFESISYYASPMEKEGRRLADDLRVGEETLNIFKSYLDERNEHAKKHKKRTYHPEMHFLMGNHEYRLDRMIESKPELDGLIDLRGMIQSAGFDVHEYLYPYWRDGVAFNHYLASAFTGRAIAGSIENKLNKTPHSFVVGHQQLYQYARRQNVEGRPHFGVVAGSFYIHDEKYRGAGNTEIRGFPHLKAFTNRFGFRDFDCDFVSLERLLENY